MHLHRASLVASGITVLSVVALTGITAESADAASSANLTVGLNYVGTVEHFGPYYAQKEGLYSKEGLNVTVDPGGTTPVATLLADGKVDIGVMDAVSMLQAAEAGQKLVAIGAEYQSSPTAMTCRKDSGVSKPSQLKGHILGLKASAETYLPLILKAAGIKKSQITIKPIGNQDISNLIAGKVDCEFSTFADNEPKSIENAGVPVDVIPLAKFGLPNQGDVYAVTKATYTSKRAELIKWLHATSEAYVKLVKDPDFAAKYMVNNAFAEGLQLSQQQFEAKAQVSYIANAWTKKHGVLALDPSDWKTTAKAAASIGITKKVINVTPMLGDLTDAAKTPKL